VNAARRRKKLAKDKYLGYAVPAMSTPSAVARIRAFNRFYTNLIGVLDRHVLRSPFSLTEVRIMYEVSIDEGGNARRLKEILSVDEGYLSRTIESLVRRGLLKRTQSAADARVFHLSLTGKGKREFRKLNGAAESEIRTLVGSLSARQVGEVVSCMARIRDLLGGGRDKA
jgi:DNA-binding MarR family transcriptional regulator